MYKKLRLAMNRRSIFLYSLIVILPLCMFSAIYLNVKSKDAYSSIEETAHRYSSFHALYIESFIGETIGRLESLALALGSQPQNDRLIEHLLKETHAMDPRFSGFYWVNSEGDITIGSNLVTDKVNLTDRPYYQQALETGKTQISEAHIGRITGRYIFSIATPVMNAWGEVNGMLVGSVQLVVMEDVIRELVRGEAVQLIDERGQVLLQTREIGNTGDWVGSSINLETVPWKVNSLLNLDDNHLILKPFLFNLLLSLFVTHIIFLLVQSFMSKHKMARELSQNEADKLRLIGTIAASTAHEIRNPLTGIKGFVSLLSAKYKDDKDQYYFSLIQKEVDRINTIVSELLFVGKPTITSKEINHVNSILDEIIPLIESEANLYNVQLSIRLTKEPVYIEVSKDHLKQIVLNLTKNALESMDSNGKLLVATERVGDSVLLTVRDTGKGMPSEVLKNIFVPFFTMKENGTGLGLVVCKRIVASYGGELDIQSQVGEGTQVTIRLPLVKA
ncbi:ATP-binding protein [Paenibacillus abyssi]|uniref:histidine kinase n=1 Tax=Paenibacillus abyssi TaxID=1340531 RepID=A0A917FUE5_9BACL|nr:ATP-binding protein [Paenibacillus abyssi]GGG06190.1 sporulation kinase D [Paenibacillus abyssi]